MPYSFGIGIGGILIGAVFRLASRIIGAALSAEAASVTVLVAALIRCDADSSGLYTGNLDYLFSAA